MSSLQDTEIVSNNSRARVEQALQQAGITPRIVEYPAGTKTAADAAAAIGCEVAQIAKSIIFKAVPSGRVVLVLTSGANRVDEKKVLKGLAEQMPGETLTKADADFVRTQTGFTIGGVAPVGHLTAPIVFMDETLTQYEMLWAAGGTASTVFPLTPQQLLQLTVAPLMDIKVD